MTSLELFQDVVNVVHVPVSTVIFREGDPGEEMFLIKEGIVDILAGTTSLARLQAGDIFGEMALIGNEPRSATAVAVSDCKLLPVDAERFLYLVQQTPYFSLHVMSVLAQRIRLRAQAGSDDAE